ncbi:MAG: hypothetical protein MJZ34_13860 [Paludibacteraceae bacterium]|nr:hypothetical protein [Paludibacteraceae bacterium]
MSMSSNKFVSYSLIHQALWVYRTVYDQELVDKIAEVIKKFDKKVYNARFFNALKEVCPAIKVSPTSNIDNEYTLYIQYSAYNMFEIYTPYVFSYRDSNDVEYRSQSCKHDDLTYVHVRLRDALDENRRINSKLLLESLKTHQETAKNIVDVYQDNLFTMEGLKEGLTNKKRRIEMSLPSDVFMQLL